MSDRAVTSNSEARPLMGMTTETLTVEVKEKNGYPRARPCSSRDAYMFELRPSSKQATPVLLSRPGQAARTRS